MTKEKNMEKLMMMKNVMIKRRKNLRKKLMTIVMIVKTLMNIVKALMKKAAMIVKDSTLIGSNKARYRQSKIHIYVALGSTPLR